MSTNARHEAATRETTIEADPNLPTIRIIRDFDAPPDKVFRAWIDRELVVQWLGPKSTEMRIDQWDARTGGNYRYIALQGGEEVAAFYGSFHEVRPSERLVQTFTWEGMPDGVSLETMTFEDLGGGRTRTIGLSVVDNLESRDAIMASGMEVGVYEGYEKLDALLAKS
ncbi:MAG TPA: SRPBCC family protein [Propionibacteriaceae bacterium]|nr:SRPBCC family protein [Propionibacteriaceae bacterium]